MSKPKVLIADKMNPLAAEIFTKKGCDVTEKFGMTPEELIAEIPNYHGLAMRSSTTVTPEILAAAKDLKVIGRAGIGVDNIDVKAATDSGVIVMNTPFGNSITTAEHAIAMMFSMARQIPQANESTHDMMKDGVRIINCARGGIVVEADLLDALNSGKVAGAALDVFEEEPAKDNILFGHENVVCTPHLGAATTEAQVNVAIQVAEQMADFLVSGAITNALNMPSISAEDAPRLKPYMKLAEQLGGFAGQITDNAIKSVSIEYEGTVAEINTKPLTSMLLATLLKTQLDTVNMVNAMSIADARGIKFAETKKGSSESWRSVITVKVETEARTRTVSGTLFTGKEPRIVDIEGVRIEAGLSEHMLFIRNDDKPGLVGQVGGILGDAGQNIANFHLGRTPEGDSAICLVSLDGELPEEVVEKIKEIQQVTMAKTLSF